MNVEERLKKLGLTLPAAPPPAANYRSWVQAGSLLFISGQLPWVGGKIHYAGHVGADLTEEQGSQAARVCALNALAQIKAALGSFERLERLVRVDGHVNSAPGFTGQPGVVNGASDLFNQVLADQGAHARVALGHNELPLNAAVELAVTALVR